MTNPPEIPVHEIPDVIRNLYEMHRLCWYSGETRRASVFSNQGFSFASRTPEIYPDYPVLYCPLILDHSVSCFHGIARVVP